MSKLKDSENKQVFVDVDPKEPSWSDKVDRLLERAWDNRVVARLMMASIFSASAYVGYVFSNAVIIPAIMDGVKEKSAVSAAPHQPRVAEVSDSGALGKAFASTSSFDGRTLLVKAAPDQVGTRSQMDFNV